MAAGKRKQMGGRKRRLTGGINALAGIALVVSIGVVVNLLVLRVPYRLRLSQLPRHRLSAASLELVGRLQGEVKVVALMSENARYRDDVLHLLREYEAAARTSTGLEIAVEEVDPLRDVGRVQSLLREYEGLQSGGRTHENTVIFDCEKRRKYVPLASLINSEMTFREDGVLTQRTVGFKGEQMLSSALRSVVESAVPRIYFLRGHGEKDPSSYDDAAGYSEVLRLLERDNMEVVTLPATEQIPEECSALVIAGPKQRLAEREVQAIRSYLERHGRVLLLQDPGVSTGLEPLLDEWGVTLGDGVVLDPRNTISGEEIVVENYGAHPAVSTMHGLISIFYLPRAVRVKERAEERADDRSRAVPLVLTTQHAWEEFSLGKQNPLQYDEGADVKGEQSLAVACERGAVGVDMNLNPTRLVVVGDSAFVSNAALSGGVGGNAAFLLGVLNWLVERDALVSVAACAPSELHLGLDSGELIRAYLRLALVLPGVIFLFGMYVYRRRRR